ncbi:MAG: flagellar protein FlgN [Tissierellia bacterium]|nr:flagellar protein FlgN [Tissierellia bacterium]
MTKEKIDKLISISEEKAKLLEDMRQYTIVQKEYIEEEDMDSLNENLDKIDDLIKQVDKLDLSFLNIFSQIKKDENVENIDELDLDKYPNLNKLKEIVTEISSTLMALSLLDKENNKNMKQKLESTKMELKKVKEGQRAYKGYNKSVTGSMMIDEKK